MSKEEFYTAPEIKAQLRKAKHIVEKSDDDRLYLVDGREGSGKSTLARQLAYVLDPTITLDRIAFTAKEFENIIKNAQKGQAIIFDEAFNGLSSKGALSKENKKLIRLLQECRQRNLYIFIVLPSIFVLERYVGLFRSHALFHVFKSKGTVNRRYYKVYNYAQKKLLYIRGKALMSYSNPRIPKTYRFYGKVPPTIDDKEYRAKKLKAFQSEDKGATSIDKWTMQRNALLHYMNKELGITQEKLSEILAKYGISVDRSGVSKHIGYISEKVNSI